MYVGVWIKSVHLYFQWCKRENIIRDGLVIHRVAGKVFNLVSLYSSQGKHYVFAAFITTYGHCYLLYILPVDICLQAVRRNDFKQRTNDVISHITRRTLDVCLLRNFTWNIQELLLNFGDHLIKNSFPHIINLYKHTVTFKYLSTH